ncbi:Ferric iron reductase FhuF-like transporter [Bacillus sp. THAF10]|uniref:IucA/IucC family C-terminal-domain containing protein n=1 Tax=Bacillus sp. THAF10 TaxID=2587848 RepID=UPI0012A987D5|nr:IucA/IucC family C-terminal-domain containing protein [Bacillus sp. THAF10]QFT90504.1 Ferric iron reductase FhuF-like transporter [Bacillus sp. THAF10]
MISTLTKQEFRFLEESCRFVAGDAKVEETISLSTLIHEGTVVYLNKVKLSLGTNDLDVAASLLMKRLGFLAVNCLVTMTVFNKTMKLNAKDIWIDSYVENDIWLPKLRYTNLLVEEAPSHNREGWRQRHFEALFGGIFTPLINRMAQEAKVSRQTLWENVMLYVYWMYESVLPNLELDAPYQEEDFTSLCQANPSIFGMRRNPAATFYKPKTFVEKHQTHIRVRTTCCYYYKTTEEGTKCSTCPLNCEKN